MYRYSCQNIPQEKSARAVGKDLPIKPKFAVEVLRAIRGRRVETSKRILEEVVALKRPVPFRKTRRNIAHQRGVGPGRFPVKVASYILKVLQEAESNAEYKGLDPERMVVRHAACHRASPIQGWRPRAHGRATPWNTHTSHIEIVLLEVEGAPSHPSPKERKPSKARKAGERARARKLRKKEGE